MKQKQKIVYILTWILIFMLTVSMHIPAYAASTKKVSGTNRFDYAYEILEKLNQQRKKKGLSDLTMDEDLLKAAMLRAAECTVAFDHYRPNGEVCSTICDKIYGENIAYGFSSPSEVMDAWMNSQGHKTNILNSDYKSVGIGCFKYKGTYYWVQSFGIAKANKINEPDSGKAEYQIALSKSAKTKFLSGAWINTDPLASKVSGVSAKAGKKKLTVSWSKKPGITGYKLQISDKKSFKNAETYILSSGKKKIAITRYAGRKLKSKKKYYVRIRAYILENAEANVYAYNKWKTLNKKTK